MKLTIGQRILLGFGVVEILALLLGLYVLYSMSRLRGIESTIKARDLTTLEMLNTLMQKQENMLALRERSVRRYLQRKMTLPDLGTAEDAGRTREEWRKVHQEVGELLKKVKDNTQENIHTAISVDRRHVWEQLVRNVDETEVARKTLYDAVEHLLDQLAEAKFDQFAVLSKVVEDRRQVLDQKMAEGIGLTKEQIRLGSELAVDTYRFAWVSTVAVLILMLILGVVAALAIQRSVTSPLGRFMEFVQEVGRGDLTNKPPSTNVTDLERLGGSLDRMVAGLKELTGQTGAATQNLNAASQEILASVQETAAGTRQQAASVQEITATVEEVSQSGNQIAERAKQVAASAEATAATTNQGLQSVQIATRSMEAIREQVEAFAEHIVALSEKTQAVGEIIAAVTDIAERSNLLALNAAIEAAGAGEHGTRFAVVASEMKNLADQAKDSTLQVQNILGAIQKGINSSVMLTEEAVKRAEAGKEQAESTESVIRQMAETTQESVKAFQQIIAATNQQQIGLNQVTQGMKDIRQAAGQTAAATGQLEKAMVNVNDLSQQLQKAVGRYRM